MNKLVIPALAFIVSCGAIVSVVVAQDAAKAPPTPGRQATNAPAAPAAAASAAEAREVTCFEGRKGATEVVQKEVQPGLVNVRCSAATGAALWYGDPFDGTVPMAKMPGLESLPEGSAVIKPRTPKLNLLAACGTGCHNGIVPKGFPKDNKPVPIPTMEAMYPASKDFQHGRGRIWCLDCHHSTQRNKLADHFGNPISFDEPQLLCGKCHGDKLRDWRDGIHGKRIGQFVTGGKQRWFTCTECHNPHDVQDGARNRGFAQLQPESPPQLPRGMKDAKFEKTHPIPH